MPSWEQDFAYLQAAVGELQEYLLSDQLYWPVAGIPGRQVNFRMPRLTLGNLLLTLQRLKAAPQDASGEDVEPLREKVVQMRKRWRVHWEQKARQETRERLPRWQHFLMELRSKNPPSASEYAYNVRLRVILDLLHSQVGERMDVESAALDNLDASLRSMLVPHDFVWDAALKPAFPAERFWYLYGTPELGRST